LESIALLPCGHIQNQKALRTTKPATSTGSFPSISLIPEVSAPGLIEEETVAIPFAAGWTRNKPIFPDFEFDKLFQMGR
jgi:hypothetical protein